MRRGGRFAVVFGLVLAGGLTALKLLEPKPQQRGLASIVKRSIDRRDRLALASGDSAPAADPEPVQTFLVDGEGQEGMMTAEEFATAYAADLTGNWWVWSGATGEEVAGSMRDFTTVGTPTASVVRTCNNGPECATTAAYRTTNSHNYLTASTHSAPTGDFSVIAVFAPETYPGEVGLVAQGDNPWAMKIDSSGILKFSSFGGGLTVDTSSGGAGNLKAVNVYAVTYQSNGGAANNTVRYYINGGVTGTPSHSTHRQLSTTAVVTRIGATASFSGQATGRFLMAALSETRWSDAKILEMSQKLLGESLASDNARLTTLRSSPMTCPWTATWGGFSWIPSNQPCVTQKGLYFAPFATNLAIQTEAVGAGGWALSSATVTTSNGKAFADGLDSMELVTTSNVSGSLAQGSKTVSSSTGPWAMSAWVSADSGTQTVSQAMRLTGTTPATCLCYRYDGGACSTRTASADCIADYTVPTTNTRIVLVATSSVAITSILPFWTSGQFGSATGAAWWGGFQVETGSHATPYIYATSSQVSRLVGNYSLPTHADVNDTEGCVSATFTSYYPTQLAAGYGILNFGTEGSPLLGNAADVTGVRAFDSTNTVNKGSLVSMFNRAATLFANWEATTLTVGEDGIAPATGTYDGAFVASTFYMGAVSGSTSQAHGHVTNIKLGDDKDVCP